MKTRTLIVDDELLARERLRQLLQSEPDIEIVGECADGREAVDAIRRESPDLIFLDVQMPELDGFGVLAAIESEPAPVIVFVTAHDRFALRAFEVHAVDYLLKPFDRERFQMALIRALEQVRNREGNALARKLSDLLADLKGGSKTPERLAVKSGGRVLFVNQSDIDWLESAHNYVEIHVGKQSHLLRQTLEAVEARLAPGRFVRISRSVIVNTDRIKELQPLFYGEYAVILQSGVRLTLSRRYRDKLEQLGLD
ncbi:MAG TPA: LytTR family DNA-binding domain-containing protein [Candidatus Paceibacterota bacterium]|nr:LytTR family DNA-binding domain-containing protein [Verrucomicrobiota bacterium]HRY48018.1 LytTR family DNA-binding domain-containing protein [Candidatus Paceibacterota bacterium]HSA00974.1 LytTR family DNA-binding domain-containing protein [Candidatus Paceibacterota bacterium]